MLHIHTSNRLEPLRALLVQHLQASGAGVFEAEQVIVPSAAMRRHLSLALADACGICANLHFDFLAQWLWRQIARVVPGVAEASPFATPQLAWRVYRAFGDADFWAPHARLGAYLAGADEVMRWELALRVAALLEQTLSYRADWLQAWREGRAAGLGEGAHADEAWQAALWRRIADELGMPVEHPAQAFADALRRDADAAARRAGLPRCVHVFALPGMAPLHLGLLQQLSGAIEVHLYALNPCREYWFDLVDRRRLSRLAAQGRAHGHEEGMRLLAAWGAQAQAQLEALLELSGEDAEDDAFFQPADGDSLLARLQNAVLDLRDIVPGSVRLAEDDRSIEVHVCHSLTRELEVLQDHLLGLFASQPGLRPGDILVVTPDLDAAAPLIDAIFGTAPPQRYMPYALSGRARSAGNTVARALLALLSLVASRCAATDVFTVLQLPAVARRFGLDDVGLAQVHEWLREAGFHWALDAQQLDGLDLPATPRHTLDDALQRLFLGYALPQQTPEPFAGLLGAGDAEGSRALALGAFWRFAETLRRLHAQLQHPMPPEAWAAALFKLLDDFVQAAGDELDELRELQGTIGQLADDMRSGGLDRALPLAVLRAALQQQLDEAARGGTAGGSVNFASMSSLRNLPFAVVCAIGMNDGAFPSAQRAHEFDLMAQHPRRGDRQRRSDERGLMLDLLLAARHSLYLSRTGRSVRDNASLPPSVLVAELLDLLVPAIATDPASTAALAQARQRLVVEHALQPFAAECFAIHGDVRLRSFNRELAEALRGSLAAAALAVPATSPDAHDDGEADGGVDGDNDLDNDAGHDPGPGTDLDLGHGIGAIEIDELDDEDPMAPSERLPPFFPSALSAPDAPWREVTLAQLVQFFRNPCRALLRRRLGVELASDADELRDDEPFLPDARARRDLALRLLPPLLQGADVATVRRVALAGTEMPAGAIGAQQLQRELDALQAFAAGLREATAQACLAPHAPRLAIALDAETWWLHADLADLRPAGLVRWRYGASRAGDYLEAWLHHLVLCAAPPQGAAPHTRWLSSDGEFSFAPCADALPLLRELLGLYRRGLRAPLRFFPRSAWMFVRHGRSKALAEWHSKAQRSFGESQDPAYQLALRGITQPLDGEFEALAAAVFGPLRRYLLDDRLKAP